MKKTLCLILIFIICYLNIFLYVNVYAEENTNNESSNETNTETDLQTQRDNLQNDIDNANSQLNDVQSELSENLQQVEKLDEKISESQKEIDKIKIEIEKIQKSLDDIKEKLKIAQENYDKQKKLLDNRLIAVYESSDTQYLDVLLTSKNLSEFLSNYFFITELASNDTELLEEMQEKKDEIEKSKNEIEKKNEDLNTIKENQKKASIILENSKAVRENFIAKLDQQEKDIQAQIDEYNTKFAEINSEILKSALEGIDTQYIGGELAWPVPGYTTISSKYGMRTHPITGVYKLHTGVDISAPLGANFVAANDGIVTKAQYNSAYGNMVMIDHGGGVSTLYAHGSEILVEVGQVVKRGDNILKVGSTGYSTGPHAHFEVRLNGEVTDPLPYITNGLVPSTQNSSETEGE